MKKVVNYWKDFSGIPLKTTVISSVNEIYLIALHQNKTPNYFPSGLINMFLQHLILCSCSWYYLEQTLAIAKMQFTKVWANMHLQLIVGHLICTLISENQGLEKLRSLSNLRKISGPAHLNFFSVDLNFFQFVNWIFFRFVP